MLAHKLLNKDEVLDNELRGRIMEHLTTKPGSYLGKISRELDVPTSTLKYHLNILRAFDFISTVKKGRCRHYFPKRRRFSDLEKRMYAAIEHEPTRRIVEIIHHNPGVSQGGLVRATGLSQSTVAWHMAKLEEMSLIRSHRNEVKEYFLRSDFEDVMKDMEERGQIGRPDAIPAPALAEGAEVEGPAPHPLEFPESVAAFPVEQPAEPGGLAPGAIGWPGPREAERPPSETPRDEDVLSPRPPHSRS